MRFYSNKCITQCIEFDEIFNRTVIPKFEITFKFNKAMFVCRSVSFLVKIICFCSISSV